MTTPTLYFKLILRGQSLARGLTNADLSAIADAMSVAAFLPLGTVQPVIISYAFTLEFAMFGLGEEDRNVENELLLVTCLSQLLGVRADAIIIDYYCAPAWLLRLLACAFASDVSCPAPQTW